VTNRRAQVLTTELWVKAPGGWAGRLHREVPWKEERKRSFVRKMTVLAEGSEAPPLTNTRQETTRKGERDPLWKVTSRTDITRKTKAKEGCVPNKKTENLFLRKEQKPEESTGGAAEAQ